MAEENKTTTQGSGAIPAAAQDKFESSKTHVRKAAEDFNRHASAQIAAEAPTAEAEAILKAVKARLCPLVCAAPKVAKDGACAVVTCEPGKMPASGSVCEPAYVAWIGSEATRDGAETIFAAAQLAHTDLLRHRQAEIKEAANGQRFSVRIGPAASKDAVRDLCAKLKSGGLAAKCYPAPL